MAIVLVSVLVIIGNYFPSYSKAQIDPKFSASIAPLTTAPTTTAPISPSTINPTISPTSSQPSPPDNSLMYAGVIAVIVVVVVVLVIFRRPKAEAVSSLK